MATGGRAGHPAVKSDLARKTEIVKDLQRLRIQEQNFEREKQTHLYAKNGLIFKDLTTIPVEDANMASARKSEKQKLEQMIASIKHMTEKFKREVADFKGSAESHQRIKEIVDESSEKIYNFREYHGKQLEELNKEERVTTYEVSVFNNKFDSWATLDPARLDTDRSDRKQSSLATQRDITKDLPAEVAAFERFMAQSGGIRGGWDDYDHGTFMKYRNRHKGKPTFIRELIGFLPIKTEEEIRSHELWYQQYMDLNEEKKIAIQKWKEKREIEKEQLLANTGGSDSEDDEEKTKKKERLEKIIEQEKQERRAQLNKWKVEKELEKAEKEERKLREELEKEKKEEADRLRHEEEKAKVEEFRQRREEENQHREYMKHMEAQIEYEKRCLATQQVQALRDRDIEQAKKRVSKTKAQEEAEKERQQRLQMKLKAQNEAHIRRDPSRLLQPTAAHRNRQNDTTKSNGGQVMQIQHRAVPTWRKT